MASFDSTSEKIREVREQGFCILKSRFAPLLVEACRQAFWPRLLTHINSGRVSNRGLHRHFFAMPFEPPIFNPQFFFDEDVLYIVRGLMDDRVVADQWGCDVPLRGSEYQAVHVDYQRPLFPEAPNLELPAYALVVSFGLVCIAREHGPIEIAPGTHRMTRMDALQAVEAGEIGMQAVPLEIGDVLIRHLWALHRGTPNTTAVPRALATIRYVRRWYADAGVNDLKESSQVQAVVDWFGPTDFLHVGDPESDLRHNAPDSPESRLILPQVSGVVLGVRGAVGRVLNHGPEVGGDFRCLVKNRLNSSMGKRRRETGRGRGGWASCSRICGRS